MKKLIALICIVATAFILCSCSAGSNDQGQQAAEIPQGYATVGEAMAPGGESESWGFDDERFVYLNYTKREGFPKPGAHVILHCFGRHVPYPCREAHPHR